MSLCAAQKREIPDRSVVVLPKEVTMKGLFKAVSAVMIAAGLGGVCGTVQAQDGISATEIIACAYQPMTGNE